MANTFLIDSADPVTLVGGGELRSEDLSVGLSIAPCLVAADGGAGAALAAGHVPRAVIGDMDSLPEETRAALPRSTLHEISEQDSTDFDKALRSIRAPFVVGVGFLGAQVDHTLANFTVLVRRPRPPCLLLGPEDVVFAAPPKQALSLDLAPGSRVSLFPLADVRGMSEGLVWPIAGLAFAPSGQIGTSNRVAPDQSGPVQLWFDAPGMLVILPRPALTTALTALCSPTPGAEVSP